MSKKSDTKEVKNIHKMMEETQLDFEEMEMKLLQSVSPFEECEVLQIELAEAKKKREEMNKRIKVLENLLKGLREMNSRETEANAVKVARLEKENAELREENTRLKLSAEKSRNKKAKGSSKIVNVNGKELQKTSQQVQTRLDGLISANYSHFRMENGEGSPVRQQKSTNEELEERVQAFLAGLPKAEPKPEPAEAEKVEPQMLPPIYPSELYYEEVAKRLPAWRMEFDLEFGDGQTEEDKED